MFSKMDLLRMVDSYILHAEAGARGVTNATPGALRLAARNLFKGEDPTAPNGKSLKLAKEIVEYVTDHAEQRLAMSIVCETNLLGINISSEQIEALYLNSYGDEIRFEIIKRNVGDSLTINGVAIKYLLPTWTEIDLDKLKSLIRPSGAMQLGYFKIKGLDKLRMLL